MGKFFALVLQSCVATAPGLHRRAFSVDTKPRSERTATSRWPSMESFCRAQLPDGSWESCSSGSSANQPTGSVDPLGTAQPPRARPSLRLLPQGEIDVATTGHWEDAGDELPYDSLGSLS